MYTIFGQAFPARCVHVHIACSFFHNHTTRGPGVDGRLLRPGGLTLVVTGNAEEPPWVGGFVLVLVTTRSVWMPRTHI